MRKYRFPGISNLDLELDLIIKFINEVSGKLITDFPALNQVPEKARFFKKVSETKYEEYVKINNSYILLGSSSSGGGSVEMRVSGGYIQYRNEGGDWQNIIAISSLKGDTGAGVAQGGITGQFLKKKSNTDYDTEWGDELGKIGSKLVDETNIGNNKILVYKTASGKYELEDKPSNGGSSSSIYDYSLPFRISGLRFWLHPESIQSSGGLAYNAWNDKTYRNNHLATINDIKHTEILGHIKATLFNSTSSYILGSTSTERCRVLWGSGATGNFTLFSVMRFTGASSSLSTFYCQYSDLSGNGIIMSSVNSSNLRFFIRDDGGSQSVYVDIPLSQFNSVPVLVVQRYDDTTKRLDVWVNGNNYNATNNSLNLASAGNGITDETSIRRFALGAFVYNSDNNFVANSGMTGEIAEFLLYVSALTSTQINQIANNMILYYGNQLGWVNL